MQEVYKQDSKGKIRVYRTYTEGAELIQETGVLDGKMVENRVECKPKNVGKSNETTGEEQAIAEMNARLKKKLKEGYYEDLEKAKATKLLLPMLAKSYDKEAKKVIFPCYAQPKLDGMRALVDRNKMTSRKGVEIETMDHILTVTSSVADCILDGELYAHGLSFQENMKLIKKYRLGESEKVIYHVYDCVLPDVPFFERYKFLCDSVQGLSCINVVETTVINNEKELMEYHAENISKGYEGTMVRWGEDGYKIDGRSSNLLKYKDFKDEVFEVIDIVPSERRPEQGIVVLKSGVHTFKATPKMSNSEKEDLLNNKDNYIGEKAEIRFFELTDGGLPRFPVCVGFRLDK